MSEAKFKNVQVNKESSWEQLIEAFKIFAEYQPSEKFVIEAEHGMIFGCDKPLKVYDRKDAEKLVSLGWMWNYEYECWVLYT